jgi:hypothetical protein
MLFLPGLTASSLSEYANAIQYNHFNKRINFGNVKTARAVDQNFNTKYEVVYLEVADNAMGAALSQEPAISQYYLYGNDSFHTIYPNSFGNMSYRLSANIGFTNRGALPDWMTSPQEDGGVLGLTRAVVLAYTVPGAAKLIAYRLKNSGINNSFIGSTYVRTHVTHDSYWASITGTVDEYIPGPQTSHTVLGDEEVDKYIKFPQTGVYR